MEVIKLTLGQLSSNCYLYFDKKTRDCLIIDPGDEPDFIYQEINKFEINPIAILATHAHFDHISAINELKTFFKIPFYIHKNETKLLKWFRASALYYTKVDIGPAPKPDFYYESHFKFNNFNLKIIETFGHTPGGVCIYDSKNQILFSGDTIFEKGIIGRTDFAYCNKKEMKKSINKLLKLPDNVLVYSGHGDEFYMKEFKSEYTNRTSD